MTTSNKVAAIITAGGTSSRFGATNKLLEKVNGKEVICHTVEAFLGANVGEVIVCANTAIIKEILRALNGRCPHNDVKIIEGGATRQESVFNGLKACAAGTTHVLIHDGARPVVSPELINRAVEMTVEKGAMTVALKTTDTIKEVENGVVVRTIEREKLYNTQTPQGFEYPLIMGAHKEFARQDFTDDAGMLEALGEKVYILEGSRKNIKITTQEDIAVAEIIIAQQLRDDRLR